jgi:hypothetical protein
MMTAVTRKVRYRIVLFAVVALLGVLAARVHAQFRRGEFRRSFSSVRLARPEDYDGTFQFCRVVFANGPNGDPRSGSWEVDYPRADINLSIRLAELTKTRVGMTGKGEPTNVLIRLTSPEMFNCPFIMMTEVGAVELNDREIASLHDYLMKGGFLWADDFWGTEAWEWWESVINQVLPPSEYPIVQLTPDHPMYRAQFEVKETPQISNIGFWTSYHDGRERGEDSPRADARAIFDHHGNMMVLMTHNTDFGDAYEREGDSPEYFLANSVGGYAFGINALLYSMTH